MPADVPSIEDFLAGLRTAWKEGEVRPTAKPAEKPKRGRRRPDPLADVTDRLRDWFEAEPWRTSRQLLEQLQAEYPGRYPDKLLRTLQRRVKVWRRERVYDLVFGPYGTESMKSESAATTAVDSRLAAARLLTVAATSRPSTAPETLAEEH